MYNAKDPRPGSSKTREKSGVAAPTVGSNPDVDTAELLGPVADTYEDELDTLKSYTKQRGDVLGPSVPVIFVDCCRKLYKEAKQIAADSKLKPYDKCVLLFRTFDAIVLVYKCVSLVYSDADGARSVYGYSHLVLKTLLSRIESIARQISVAVHDAYSLTALNSVVASAEQRLAQVRSEKDMMEFFRGVSGVSEILPSDGITAAAAVQLPRGIERYTDPYPEADTLLRRLYAFNADKDYIRDFHDAIYLIATANAPGSLSSALETRLTDKDRNVILLNAPGDRLFASNLCSSAIAFLRKKLNNAESGGGGGKGTVSSVSDDIETYRINYGRIFSKYRGESERNFDTMMEWMKNAVRGSDRFRIFWFPDIENLMSPRTGNDQEHIAAIKNSMLQHMDAFNKDRTLRSFLLLFNASEGVLDSAFARRLETVIKTPLDPLTDRKVAFQVVGAEITRYRINLSDGLAVHVAASAGSIDVQRENSHVGGFAYVQATLRDLYVSQKLALRHGTKMVDTKTLSTEELNGLLGRYTSDGNMDTLYGLNERPLPPLEASTVGAIAFGLTSSIAQKIPDRLSIPVKYYAAVKGDPKNVDERTASRTVFMHDVEKR